MGIKLTQRLVKDILDQPIFKLIVQYRFTGAPFQFSNVLRFARFSGMNRRESQRAQFRPESENIRIGRFPVERVPVRQRVVFGDPAISAVSRHPFGLARDRFGRDFYASRHESESLRVYSAFFFAEQEIWAVNSRKKYFFGILVFDFIEAADSAVVA